MPNPEPTAALVSTLAIQRDDKILFLIEDLEGVRKLNLPGGHIELGEAPTEAAIREAREETGLEIQSLFLLGVVQYTWKARHSLQFLFRATASEGEIHLESGAEALWLTIQEARAHLKKMAYVTAIENVLSLLEQGEGHATRDLFLYDRRDGKRDLLI